VPARRSRSRRVSGLSVFRAIHEMAFEARQAVGPSGRLMTSEESKTSAIVFCTVLGRARVTRASAGLDIGRSWASRMDSSSASRRFEPKEEREPCEAKLLQQNGLGLPVGDSLPRKRCREIKPRRARECERVHRVDSLFRQAISDLLRKTVDHGKGKRLTPVLHRFHPEHGRRPLPQRVERAGAEQAGAQPHYESRAVAFGAQRQRGDHGDDNGSQQVATRAGEHARARVASRRADQDLCETEEGRNARGHGLGDRSGGLRRGRRIVRQDHHARRYREGPEKPPNLRVEGGVAIDPESSRPLRAHRLSGHRPLFLTESRLARRPVVRRVRPRNVQHASLRRQIGRDVPECVRKKTAQGDEHRDVGVVIPLVPVPMSPPAPILLGDRRRVRVGVWDFSRSPDARGPAAQRSSSTLRGMNTSPLSSPGPWNLVAAAYANEIVPMFEHYSAEALRLAKVPSGGAIVDVAAGPGTLSVLAARAQHHVSAVDFSEEMVSQLRLRLDREQLTNVDVTVGDGMRLPYANGAFQGAFSMFGLMFFPDRGRGFRELHHVLADGARAVVSSWLPLDRVPRLALCARRPA